MASPPFLCSLLWYQTKEESEGKMALANGRLVVSFLLSSNCCSCLRLVFAFWGLLMLCQCWMVRLLSFCAESAQLLVLSWGYICWLFSTGFVVVSSFLSMEYLTATQLLHPKFSLGLIPVNLCGCGFIILKMPVGEAMKCKPQLPAAVGNLPRQMLHI